MMAKMPPEVAARLAALETTDEILSDTRNHTPAQIERRRNILRQRIEIDIELEATSASAEQRGGHCRRGWRRSLSAMKDQTRDRC
jgi:hypothetical protein